MDHEAAFLRDICQNPDDDIPRLIYADWLEEQGNPRGEFIRVQCELAQLPHGKPKRKKLLQRQLNLLAANAREWLVNPKQTLRISPYSYRFLRGFLQMLGLSGYEFVNCGDQLFQVFPTLSELRLNTIEQDLYWIAQVPSLGQLWTLDLSNNYLGNEGVEVLARWPALTNIRTLILINNRIDCSGAVALASSRFLSKICKLDLHKNEIGTSGHTALRGRFGKAVLL